MADYKLTNKAIEDLNEIWNYTYDKWSEDQADQYYKMILSKCQVLADSPGLGKNYNDIIEGLCGFRVSKHIIFYRINAAQPIEITRILHKRMDLKSRIAE
ncbi:MAG: type II toxin-antitoxin system RelE/ParE family toxin [Cyclobacteriaceae bacterium]